MKQETKYKIIRWVMRLLKYKEHLSPIKIQEQEVNVAKWEAILYQWDIQNNLKKLAANGIAKGLMEANALEIEVIQEPSTGADMTDTWKATAHLKYLKAKTIL